MSPQHRPSELYLKTKCLFTATETLDFTQGVAALHHCTKQFQELICEFVKCFEILQDEECHKMEVIIPLAKKTFSFFFLMQGITSSPNILVAEIN